ncbi:putative integral membrane protein [Rosellinia necatrix]|uniref:Putative integral membrane protein n=1 Tax=Rosellinia necatrix TaxID=77044 RepID=A0A1S7UKY3_ROSNE|nr:putative integral membrane protein [Rosellinia necatrix]
MLSSNATEQIPWTPWTAPDLESQRSRHGTTPMLGLLVWAIMGLAMFLVILRIYYHVFRGRRQLWSDDYFLIAALVCLIGNGIAIEQWIPYKFEPNLTTPQIPALVLIGSLMGLFNSLALALSKTSLAITFIRLTTGWWKSSLGLSIFAIDCLFAVQAWSFWVPDCGIKHEPYRIQTAGGACISYESIKSFRFAVQTLSCVLDAYFTILPWKIVRPLALKRFEKIGLGIAMSFGCASLMSGIIRELILFHLSNEPSEYQPLYSVGGFLFNYFEPSFTIIAACIPRTPGGLGLSEQEHCCSKHGNDSIAFDTADGQAIIPWMLS